MNVREVFAWFCNHLFSFVSSMMTRLEFILSQDAFNCQKIILTCNIIIISYSNIEDALFIFGKQSYYFMITIECIYNSCTFSHIIKSGAGSGCSLKVFRRSIYFPTKHVNMSLTKNQNRSYRDSSCSKEREIVYIEKCACNWKYGFDSISFRI